MVMDPGFISGLFDSGTPLSPTRFWFFLGLSHHLSQSLDKGIQEAKVQGAFWLTQA